MVVVDDDLREPPTCGFDVWILHPDEDDAATMMIRGPLDEHGVRALGDALMDIVFALPTQDVILDLRGVTELCPATRQVIHNAELALHDQGAELHLLGPAA